MSWLIAGVVVSAVNASVLIVAAVRALSGPFNNAPFAGLFVGLAFLGPGAATVTHRGARRRGVDVAPSRHRAGTVLFCCGLPVLAVSLLLLII